MKLAIDSALLQRRISQLPSWPRAAAQALESLRDEATGADECARCIGHDQALTARVLRLANSAFYGVPGRVASVNSAIQMLGKRTLGAALTAATANTQFNAIGCAGFDYDSFWRHAVGTAIAAESIARARLFDDEAAFTAGLLHDIGRLALAAHFPQEAAAVLTLARDSDLPWLEAEHRTLDTDHATIGASIAAYWRFPSPVQAAIASHHRPQPSSGAAGLDDVIHVADAMAHALDLAGDPHEAVPEVDPQSWQRLALNAEQVLALLQRTEQGVGELCRALAN
jgi:putative nucleotidyltransferase with HDIG domain